MNKIILSTENTCDIPLEKLDQLNVKHISLGLTGQDGVLLRDIKINEFYNRLKAGEMFKTSLVNEFEYQEYFSELIKEGDVLHIALTSGVSGSCACAKNASETLNKRCQNKVYVVDSLSGSGGQAIILQKAMELIEQGLSIEEVVEKIEQFKHSVRLEFSPEDLTTLARGGRCNKIVATIGNILNLKPIIYINKEGSFSVRQKVIGRKKALNRLIELFKENYNHEYKTVYILHGNKVEDAEYIKSKLVEVEEYKDVDFRVEYLGFIVSAHGGVGNMCLTYTSNNR